MEYLEYWKHRQILSKELCNKLFGNITEIYEFSKIFLNELELANNSVSQIARCFLNNHLRFIVYSTYCIHFQDSSVVLSEIMHSRPTVNIVRQRQKELGHRLPLSSYLVLPIQRILRYHLLLKKLAAYTSEDEADHALVTKAYNKMVLLAKIIDETKNKYEKGGRVKMMRSIINQWKNKSNVKLPNNCFELHAEGDLMIAGTKKKLHVILLNNMLLIAKEQKCGLLEYKAHISNRNIIVIENVKGNPLGFRLVSNDAETNYSFTFQASLMDDKLFWIKMLNDMKEDTSRLSKVGLAELMAEYFYLPKTIKLNNSKDLFKNSL
ncbi:Hypothetical protein CINCED_3A016938 [Cinara cedri]|uniref:Uncharacterized protein n=1 Tax=Cinara cedri TaxID=506608 RepID=A0A5E4MYI6_9HEMI|nr:Hypothetical protein CINCED_3A016938 [Cinara cedri]